MAKSRLRTFFLSLAAIAVLIQLVPIQRDNPPVTGHVTATPEVMSIRGWWRTTLTAAGVTSTFQSGRALPAPLNGSM
jgi:hypothetical protein